MMENGASSSQVPSPQPFKKWHYDAFLFLVLGVVIGGIGSYFVMHTDTNTSISPSPLTQGQEGSISSVPTAAQVPLSPSVNLKTYLSPTGLFTFKYPENWENVTGKNELYLETELAEPLTKDCLPPNGCGGVRHGIRVFVFSNDKLLTIPQFIQAKNLGLPDGYTKSQENYGINTPWLINRNAPGAGNSQDVFIADGRYIIELLFELNDTQTNAILSTFTIVK